MLVQMKQIEINHFQFVGFKLLTFFRYICYEIKYLERARIISRRRQVAIAHEIENSVQLVLRHKHSRNIMETTSSASFIELNAWGLRTD